MDRWESTRVPSQSKMESLSVVIDVLCSGALRCFASSTYTFGEDFEDSLGLFEVDARVGDALAVYAVFAGVVLAPSHEVALNHDAHDGVRACFELVGDILRDDRLTFVV